jgi:hypothetical protein
VGDGGFVSLTVDGTDGPMSPGIEMISKDDVEESECRDGLMEGRELCRWRDFELGARRGFDLERDGSWRE